MNNTKCISLILLLSMSTMQPSWDYMSPVKTIIPWVGWVGFIGALSWIGWDQLKIQKSMRQELEKAKKSTEDKQDNSKSRTNDAVLEKILADAGITIELYEHRKQVKKITIGNAYTYTPANQSHTFITYAMKDKESVSFFDLPGVELFSIENKEGKFNKKMDQKFLERCLSQDWAISE